MNLFSKLVRKQVAPMDRFASLAGRIGVGAAVSAKWSGVDRPGKVLEFARRGNKKDLGRALASGSDVEARMTAGMDVETRSLVGSTALMLAARGGHGDCVGLLVSAGADVEACGDDGQTASMIAARSGRSECLGLLIRAGANLDAKDRRGGRQPCTRPAMNKGSVWPC